MDNPDLEKIKQKYRTLLYNAGGISKDRKTELALKAYNFFRELEELCNKYSADIHTGCGCCGAGYSIDGYSVD
jgi:hypothetical protein